jgi:hypothetical protein
VISKNQISRLLTLKNESVQMEVFIEIGIALNCAKTADGEVGHGTQESRTPNL